MLGSVSPIYEIVSGQVLLNKREEFTRLHETILLPLVREAGIEPVLMLVTEVGYYARFINIYRYPSLEEYGKRSDAFMKDQRVTDFFANMIPCTEGSLQVELAVDLVPISSFF